MIELLPETRGNVIALKMSGTVTEDDQDRYFEKAEIILEKERVEHLLLDWEHLDGWAKGARTVGTWFGMHHRALVGRVAIIADEKWADEVLRITDIFRAATVRQFAPGERAAAFAWIRQG
jgi:stage II sporulation SpoAA-like protein